MFIVSISVKHSSSPCRYVARPSPCREPVEERTSSIGLNGLGGSTQHEDPAGRSVSEPAAPSVPAAGMYAARFASPPVQTTTLESEPPRLSGAVVEGA